MVFKENFRDISSFGGLPLYIVMMLVFLLIGIYDIFYQLLFGLGVIYVMFFGVRSIYFKERPKKQKFKNWLQKIDANSFPSAHVLRATVLGIIIANFLSNVYVSLIILIVVILTGFSRVKLRQHFWNDVIFGWIFGFVIGVLSVKFF